MALQRPDVGAVGALGDAPGADGGVAPTSGRHQTPAGLVSGHRITLSLDLCDGVSATFHCEEPPTAACRADACPLGCDEYAVELDGRGGWEHVIVDDAGEAIHHPLPPGEDCNVVSWLCSDDAYWWENYGGGSTEARSGPITATWAQRNYGWTYAVEGAS